MDELQDGSLGVRHLDVWALVFALQFLLIAQAGTSYAWLRFGRAKTWIVATPILILAFLLVFDQITKLLPNLT